MFNPQRYFTLQNGTLSYFQNEEEVNMGAKASIRVASCEVTPDTIDNKRFLNKFTKPFL